MRWEWESQDARTMRAFRWHARFAFLPHACDNAACGTVTWLEGALSRLESYGYGGAERLWACALECAEVQDLEVRLWRR
jgi:hypothetical protein